MHSCSKVTGFVSTRLSHSVMNVENRDRDFALRLNVTSFGLNCKTQDPFQTDDQTIILAGDHVGAPFLACIKFSAGL